MCGVNFLSEAPGGNFHVPVRVRHYCRAAACRRAGSGGALAPVLNGSRSSARDRCRGVAQDPFITAGLQISRPSRMPRPDGQPPLPSSPSPPFSRFKRQTVAVCGHAVAVFRDAQPQRLVQPGAWRGASFIHLYIGSGPGAARATRYDGHAWRWPCMPWSLPCPCLLVPAWVGQRVITYDFQVER